MKYILFLLLITFSISLKAQSPTKWDLKTCIEYAIEHNISVQQADIQSRLAKLQADLAKSNQLPTINGSSGMGLRLGRSIDPTTNAFTNTQFLYNNFGLNGGIQIFNAGRLTNASASSNFSWQASEADKLNAINDVSLSVATFYLQVLSAIEQTEITKIQISQTKEQLAATKKRVEVGLLPELNLLELETQLANDSSTYISANANIEQSKMQLKALLNLDASQPFDIQVQSVDDIKLQSFADLQPDYVFNVATQNLPSVKAAEITQALELASKHQTSFITDLNSIGSTSFFSTIGKVQTHFGINSAAFHRQAQAIELIDAQFKGIKADCDDWADLLAIESSDLGHATRALMEHRRHN